MLKTAFVNGLNYGMIHGSMIYLLPANANTSGTPTLNVNQLGAFRIVKFGNQPLGPGDLTHAALAHLIYDGNVWQLLNPQTNQGTVTSVTATAPLASSGGTTPIISCPTCVTAPTLTGTTAGIGGAPLAAGTCTTGSATVTGATVGHPVSVSASDGSLHQRLDYPERGGNKFQHRHGSIVRDGQRDACGKNVQHSDSVACGCAPMLSAGSGRRP